MYFNNDVNLDGRLTVKPELKESKSGIKYCNFSLCWNERKKLAQKDEDGNEWTSVPHFFNCTCWKYEAECIAKLEKGQAISVVGKLHNDTWTDDQGNKKSKVIIAALHVRKLEFEEYDKEETAESETLDIPEME